MMDATENTGAAVNHDTCYTIPRSKPAATLSVPWRSEKWATWIRSS